MSNVYDNERFFEKYAQMDRSAKGLSGAGEWHALAPLFPDLKDKLVLDLGCGYGWHCKYAVECGAARVTGIDLSEKMIARAKEINADSRITYQVMGLDDFDYPFEAYDCVISNLVLHYVEQLDAIYRRVYQTLKPGGVFLFNIEHPVFTAGVREEWVLNADGQPKHWPVDRYFEPGARSTCFLGETVEKQHHTLTQILMGLLGTGFQLEAVMEPEPPADMMHLPGMRDELRRPMMLLVRARKA